MHLINPLRCLAVGLAVVCFVCVSHGLDPNRLTSQYVREQWNVERELPGGSVNAIGQTADGYLWIGTDNGLIRFDGFNLHPVPFSSPVPNPNSPVLGLTTDAEGNLLVRLQGAGLLRKRNGKFESIDTGPIPAASQVTAMWRNGNGEVLLWDLSNSTLRLRNEKVERVELPKFFRELPPVVSIAEAPSGDIWFGTINAGLFSLTHGQNRNLSAELPYEKINCLLPVSDTELWIGTDHGAFRWDGKKFTSIELPSSVSGAQILTILKDRDSNVWIGTTRGLLRINDAGTSFSDESEVRGSGGINTLFEDREGNLWVGGARGIERIRDSAFITYSRSDGLASERIGPVYVDSQNRTWFAPDEGGLYLLTKGKVQSIKVAGLDKDVIYSINGRKDTIWVGRQNGGLTSLQFSGGALRSQTYTKADGLIQNSVFAVYPSRDGTVWAGTLSGGVSSLKDGRFTTYTISNGLAANSVSSILETRDGTIWFATSNGLTSLSKGAWRTYATQEGLPSSNVNCLFEDSSGALWIGTSEGPALFRSEHIQSFPQISKSLHGKVFGITEDKNQRLWIATANQIMRVQRDKLSSGTLTTDDIREYGSADGLQSTEVEKRDRSVIADSTGRIWISTRRGLSVVDPSHITGNSVPAMAQVETISADNTPIALGRSVRVPPSPKRITFSYTGLSLAIPDHVRFRYLLDGFDRAWSEPVSTREAIYTNLGPGSYRFRLVASNSDGVWNGPETSVDFEVEPGMWQTWWFRSACVVFVGLSILLLYQLRLRQLTHQLNIRFEERLAERTRIAQDLHDTLLQGFISASMQLSVANRQLPGDWAAKPIVSEVLVLMRHVIDEGRNAVRGMRLSSGNSDDLGLAFSRVPQELALEQTVGFRIIVQGPARPLHPLIRDEVYRIGREALVNAFRHSRATNIEVELEYADSELRVLVRDDGCGIDPQVLSAGREGHWGLSGMRERAEGIGGKLRVWSATADGTEVELSIPGNIAFQLNSVRRGLQWLIPFNSKKMRNEEQKKERVIRK